LLDTADNPQDTLPRSRDKDKALSEDALRDYIDLFLMYGEEYDFERSERSLKNPDVVDYVLSQPIVIERSPPFHITLKGLLTTTNLPICIGTYMGSMAAGLSKSVNAYSIFDGARDRRIIGE
jgi:hypothetical protein